MRLSHPRLTISAVAVAAVAATTGVAVAASTPSKSAPAVNTAAGSVANLNATDSVALTESEASVQAYWTPAKVAAALKNGSPPVYTGKSANAGAADAPVETAGAQAKKVTNYKKGFFRTTGKIFFRRAGRDYVCSGSAVVAKNKSTVWTAGHCLNDGRGNGRANWASYVLFRPGYRNGKSLGQFVATRMIASQGWTRKGNPGYDIGAFKVKRSGGKTLQARVGGQRIKFNIGGFKHSVRSHGYPELTNKGKRMNGQIQWFCSGKTWGFRFSDFPGVTNRAMRCTMGPGSSGGPWLWKVGPKGYGQIIGMVSHGVDNGRFVSSPYLGKAAVNVYNAIKG